MRKALLLVALLLLAGGPVYSSGVIDVDYAPVRQTVSMVLRTSSSTEIVHVASGQLRKTASWGRYVRWSGAIVIGSALVYTALDYFYNHLRQQTGTPLDTWYYWVDVEVLAGIGNYSAWVDGPRCNWPDPCVYRCGYGYRAAYYAFSLPGGLVGEVVSRVMCKSLCTGGIPLLKHLLQHLLHLREPL